MQPLNHLPTPDTAALRTALSNDAARAAAARLAQDIRRAAADLKPSGLLALAVALHGDAPDPVAALREQLLGAAAAVREFAVRAGVALKAETERQANAVGTAVRQHFELLQTIARIEAQVSAMEGGFALKRDALQRAGASAEQAAELAHPDPERLAGLRAELHAARAELEGINRFLSSREDSDAPAALATLLAA